MSVFSFKFGRTCLLKGIVVLLCLYLSISQGYSQAVVHNGDLDIFSDGDVPNNVTSITRITGALSIGGSISSFPQFSSLEVVNMTIDIIGPGYGLTNPSLTTFDSIFPSLRRVGGNVKITASGQLISISGFDSLQEVGRDLFVSYNTALISIPEFPLLERINGSLRIGSALFYALNGNPLLKNISGFNSLQHVGGRIDILKNSAITSLTEFDALNHVGGDVLIWYNDNLMTLNNIFPGLTTIGNNVQFTNNDRLVSVSGFDSLDNIGGELYIVNNKALVSIPEFPLLNSIGNHILVDKNPKLASISGFDSLRTVHDIDINTNLSLANISGFNALTGTEGKIAIHANPVLAQIVGFAKLSSISGELFIHNNYSLTTLPSFLPLRHIGSILHTAKTPLTVSNNASLTDLSTFTLFRSSPLPTDHTLGGNGGALFEHNGGNRYVGGDLFILSDILLPSNLDSISRITGDLIIGGNLSVFPDLAALQAIDGSLRIGDDFPLNNPSLTMLSDVFPLLASVNSVYENLTIAENSFLTSISGFDSLQRVGRGLVIRDNPLLTALPNFSSVRSIRNIAIKDNENLIAISGFDSLRSISGTLGISNNKSLATVSGFNRLHTIGWKVLISDNLLLTTIPPFPALRFVGLQSHYLNTPISIWNNPLLVACDVVRPFSLKRPGYQLGGANRIYVTGNAVGCNAVTAPPSTPRVSLSITPSIVGGVPSSSGMFTMVIDISDSVSNSATSWSITKTDMDDFVTLPATHGTQDSTLAVSYAENTGMEIRTATLTVTVMNADATMDSTFTVSQMAAAHSGTVTGVGVTSTEGLKIYPNPSTGHFVIDYDKLEAKVQLLDFTGRIVPVDEYITFKTDTRIELDLSSLSKGTYLLKVDDQHSKLLVR